jgi:predicted  nucleic acid-binding Zn-ribbon protein
VTLILKIFFLNLSPNKALEASVPASELEAANRQYAALTARYRDLLAQQAAGSTAARTLQELELTVAAFRREKEMLAKELTTAKEKVASLEVLFSAVSGGGAAGHQAKTTDSSQLEIERLAKQVRKGRRGSYLK